MTPDEYLQKSANIKNRLEIVRGQIDAHVTAKGNSQSSLIQPLINRQQAIISELLTLDAEYFQDA